MHLRLTIKGMSRSDTNYRQVAQIELLDISDSFKTEELINHFVGNLVDCTRNKFKWDNDIVMQLEVQVNINRVYHKTDARLLSVHPTQVCYHSLSGGRDWISLTELFRQL